MTPLPETPIVVLNVVNGNIVAVASNISPNLKIVLTNDWATFTEESCNRPFKEVNPDTSLVNGKAIVGAHLA